jgi:hypothetical protein
MLEVRRQGRDGDLVFSTDRPVDYAVSEPLSYLYRREHDDWYDPDFLIYNDVIVEDWKSNIWMYAYPIAEFPPTDFHTATLLNEDHESSPSHLQNGILVIGGLGYLGDREYWNTPIYRLDLDGMWFRSIETNGDNPGRICRHRTALLDGGVLMITGGEILDDFGVFHPNRYRFELDLWTRTWTRTT